MAKSNATTKFCATCNKTHKVERDRQTCHHCGGDLLFRDPQKPLVKLPGHADCDCGSCRPWTY